MTLPCSISSLTSIHEIRSVTQRRNHKPSNDNCQMTYVLVCVPLNRSGIIANNCTSVIGSSLLTQPPSAQLCSPRVVPVSTGLSGSFQKGDVELSHATNHTVNQKLYVSLNYWFRYQNRFHATSQVSFSNTGLDIHFPAKVLFTIPSARKMRLSPRYYIHCTITQSHETDFDNQRQRSTITLWLVNATHVETLSFSIQKHFLVCLGSKNEIISPVLHSLHHNVVALRWFGFQDQWNVSMSMVQ